MIGVVILSGGQGKRMGGMDKGLAEYQGKTFFETVLEQLKPQAEVLQKQTGLPVKFFVSANRNLDFYQSKCESQKLDCQVVTDIYPESLGPMAGMVSVMKSDPRINRWLFCPVDCLELPSNYLSRIYSNSNKKIISIRQQGQLYPTHISLPKNALVELESAIQENRLSIRQWLAETNLQVLWSRSESVLKKFNENC